MKLRTTVYFGERLGALFQRYLADRSKATNMATKPTQAIRELVAAQLAHLGYTEKRDD